MGVPARLVPGRRIWLAGPVGWVVGAVGPAVPVALVGGVRSAEVLPGPLFLLVVFGVTALAGRGPGLLAAVVSTVMLAALLVLRPLHDATHPAGRWLWIGVYLILSVAAVFRLDQLLRDAAQRATAVLDPLVQACPAGITLLDRELRFVRVNPALTMLSPLPPASYLDHTLAEISPHLPPRLCTQLGAVLTTGTALSHEPVTIEFPGEPIRQLSVDAFPVRPTGPTGPITGVGVILTDVTAQHRLAQLEQEAAQLRATAQLNHRLAQAQRVAGLVGFDYDRITRVATWSPELCALLGRSETPARHDHSFQHPDEIDRISSVVRTTMATGAPFSIQTRLLHTDGRVLEVLLHGEAVRAGGTADGEITGYWGVVQDLTEVHATQRTFVAARHAMEDIWGQALAERRLLADFQRALLPTELPRIPGAELIADYFAVADKMDIGGDWYDAFALPDGRIALSIGDVIGHDLQAAAIMGQVRAVARGYAVLDPDPGSVLTRLNRLVALAFPSTVLISAVVAIYDPHNGQLQWANAGHPHPLLAAPADGGPTITVLDHAEPIMGILDDIIYPTQQGTLPEHATLLCYTDGLVEHHANDLQVSEARLRALLADAVGRPVPLPAERLMHQLQDVMHANGPPEDDVCILILQRLPASHPALDYHGCSSAEGSLGDPDGETVRTSVAH